MSTDRSRLATRLALESFVIMASILAAFALDTWWDGRQERAEEQETLAALEVDFRSARANILTYRRYQERIREGLIVLTDALNDAWTRGERTASVPAGVLGIAFVSPTVSLSLGTLEGLISSGHLTVLQDPELRAALGAWGIGLAELAEEESGLREDLTEVDALLGPRINTTGLRDIGMRHLDEPEWTGPKYPLLADTEHIALFERRRFAVGYALTEYDALLEEVDTILALIARSLDP